MGNTRFIPAVSNRSVRTASSGTYPRIINGNGAYAGAPARVEDAAYPMENVLNPDRYTPWDCGDGSGSPVVLEIDLGSNQSIAYAGVHGMRYLLGGIFPSTVNVYSQASGTYSAGGYAIRAAIQMSGTPRDRCNILAGGPISARYWKFEFLNTGNRFSVGSLWLAPITYDLGMLYSPGLVDAKITPTIVGRTGGQHPQVVVIGDDRRLVSMPLTVDDATKNMIDSAFSFKTGLGRPAVWINQDDQPVQVILANSQIEWTHDWAAPNRWSTVLELEVLG